MKFRRLRIVLAVIFAAVFLFSGFMIARTLWEYHSIEKAGEVLQERFVSKRPAVTRADNVPDTAEAAPITVDFEALQAENADVIGWLYCEGTPINYPVMQSGDNDYYLHRDLAKKTFRAGSLFADFRCTPPQSGQLFLIFGHSMKNGSMFGTLYKFREQAYYEAHPVMYLLTPAGDYRIDLAAGMATEPDDDLYRLDNETLPAALTRFTEGSAFDSPVTLTPADSVIALSTCAYGSDGSRFVLLGRAVPLF